MNRDGTTIFQNSEYLILTKKATELSQGFSDQDRGLHEIVLKNTGGKSHLLTRLDRPVSGLMLFSLTARFTKHYLDLQEKGLISKKYVAIVEGQLTQVLGENIALSHYHVHDKKNLKARLSHDASPKSTSVTLSYKVLEILDRYSILEISLPKGKFHQIRAQLAFDGFPIKGDVKYGARRGNRDRSIHLHSHSIHFRDREGNEQHYVSPIPEEDTLWRLAQTHLAKNK